jgi:hypothetical protein
MIHGSSTGRRAAAGDQQSLVDLEVQHLAIRERVSLGEGDRGRLARAVGERVRVSDAFVLAGFEP